MWDKRGSTRSVHLTLSGSCVDNVADNPANVDSSGRMDHVLDTMDRCGSLVSFAVVMLVRLLHDRSTSDEFVSCMGHLRRGFLEASLLTVGSLTVIEFSNFFSAFGYRTGMMLRITSMDSTAVARAHQCSGRIVG